VSVSQTEPLCSNVLTFVCYYYAQNYARIIRQGLRKTGEGEWGRVMKKKRGREWGSEGARVEV